MKNVFVLVTIPSKFYLYSEKKVQKNQNLGPGYTPFLFCKNSLIFKKNFNWLTEITY